MHVHLRAWLGLSLALATTVLAGPTEDALRVGEESLAAGDRQAAKTTWLNAYNERATAETATDETCAKLLQKVGELCLEDGDARTALAIYEKLLPLREALSGANSTETAIVSVTFAELIVTTGGDTTRAERLSKEAAATFEKAGKDFDPHRFEAMLNIAYARYGRKDRIGAQTAYLEALEFGKSHEGIDPEGIAVCYRMLANISAFFGRSAEALGYAQQAVEQLLKTVGPAARSTIENCLFYGPLLPLAERPTFYASVIKDLEAAPKTPVVHQGLAELHSRMALMKFNELNDREGSLAHFRNAVTHAEKGYGETNGALISPLLNLAKVMLVMKRYEEGAAAYRKIYAIRKKVLGPDHADTIQTQELLQKLESQISAVKN